MRVGNDTNWTRMSPLLQETAISEFLMEDARQVVEDDRIPWKELRGRNVLITGATGLIGSAIVRILAAANERRGLKGRIVAVGRNRTRGESLAGLPGVEFLEHDVRQPFDIPGAIDFIIHGAATTQSAAMAANPVGVIETSLSGTANALALARAKNVRGMVYLSSVEVYGATDADAPFVDENGLGRVDPLIPRSCYPESKRMCECLCACWHAQFGLPVGIARLAQTFGAGTYQDDTRVFVQFARSALAGEDIVLHTEGKSRGNYCYISDVVAGILVVLLKGAAGEAYNIANPEASMTIREMAELVAKTVGGGAVSVVFDKSANARKLGYAPDATVRLGADKLKMLGWTPKYGLADMYKRMVAEWSR